MYTVQDMELLYREGIIIGETKEERQKQKQQADRRKALYVPPPKQFSLA